MAVGAFALSRTIASLLFGIEPGDPVTGLVVLVLVLVAGALATIVPTTLTPLSSSNRSCRAFSFEKATPYRINDLNVEVTH